MKLHRYLFNTSSICYVQLTTVVSNFAVTSKSSDITIAHPSTEADARLWILALIIFKSVARSWLSFGWTFNYLHFKLANLTTPLLLIFLEVKKQQQHQLPKKQQKIISPWNSFMQLLTSILALLLCHWFILAHSPYQGNDSLLRSGWNWRHNCHSSDRFIRVVYEEQWRL